MTKLDKEKYIDELYRLREMSDIELAHIEADVLLCRLLNELGYEDVVEAWWNAAKWYA